MTDATEAVRAALAREPYLSITDLARATRLPRDAVKAALAQLAAEGGVTRSLSAADGPIVERWVLPRRSVTVA